VNRPLDTKPKPFGVGALSVFEGRNTCGLLVDHHRYAREQERSTWSEEADNIGLLQSQGTLAVGIQPCVSNFSRFPYFVRSFSELSVLIRGRNVCKIVLEKTTMLPLRTELVQIVRCFNQAEIEYGLCGGLAVAVHGYVRATKDIDVLIRPESLENARNALTGIGYDLEAGLMKFDG
jgi:hypothetical protein